MSVFISKKNKDNEGKFREFLRIKIDRTHVCRLRG